MNIDVGTLSPLRLDLKEDPFLFNVPAMNLNRFRDIQIQEQCVRIFNPVKKIGVYIFIQQKKCSTKDTSKCVVNNFSALFDF